MTLFIYIIIFAFSGNNNLVWIHKSVNLQKDVFLLGSCQNDSYWFALCALLIVCQIMPDRFCCRHTHRTLL